MMKNKALRKSLSVFLSVLMVLSCWVFVAPTTVEAAVAAYTANEATKAVNENAIGTLPDLTDTAVTTVYGKFEADEDYLDQIYMDKTYHNVLYTDGTVSKEGGGQAVSAKTEYGSSWTGSNGVTVRWYHAGATLMYDGDTSELPRLGLAMNTIMYNDGTWSKKSVNRLSWVSDGNGFAVTQNWRGQDSRLNLQWMVNGCDELIGYTSTVVNDSMRTTISGDSDNHFYANILKFTGTMADTEYVRVVTPTFSFYGDNGSTAKTISATSTKNLVVINYVPLKNALAKAFEVRNTIAANPKKYTTASVAKFVELAKALYAAKPNNFVNSTTNNYNGYASAAKAAVEAYNAWGGLEERTYEIGYENLFSLSDWLNSNSSNFPGTKSVDINKGTITLTNTAESGDHEQVTDSSGNSTRVKSYYAMPIEGGKEYTFEYTIDRDSDTQGFMFFYASNVGNSQGTYGVYHMEMTKAGTCKKSFLAPEGAQYAEIRFDVNKGGETATFSNIAVYKTERAEEIELTNWTTRPYRKLYTYNSSFNANALDTAARIGYTFDKWTFADGTSTPSTMTQSYTVYSNWTINQYWVRFYYKDGSLASGKQYDYGTLAKNIATPSKHSDNTYDSNYHYVWSWPTVNDLGAADVRYDEVSTPAEHSYVSSSYKLKDDTYHTVTCNRCGYSYDEKHTESSAATCQTKAHCDICTGNYGELGPHKEVTVSGTAASCAYEGLKDGKECEVCGTTTVEQEKIPPLGHTYTQFVDNNDGSTHTKTCLVCEADEPNKSVKENHNWGDPTQTKAPTCNEKGTNTYTCKDCGATKTEDIDATGAHTWSETYTDSKDGATHYATCTVCGTKGEAINHTWNDGVVDPDSTCASKGTKTYTCTADGCGATYTEDVGEKSHTLTKTDAKPAKCEESGNNAYWTCSVCGKVFSDENATTETTVEKMTIAPLGHDYTGTIKSDGNGKAATHSYLCNNGCGTYGNATAHTWNDGVVTTEPKCEEKGVKTFTCTVDGCGATYTEEIAANGHSFTKKDTDSKYLASEATCTAAAKYYYSCEACGATGDKTFESGEANGHSFTDYKSNNDATCTADGTKTAKCDNCDETDTITDEGSKKEHSFTKKDTDSKYLASEATCTEKATYYYSCANCGATGTKTFDYGEANGHSFTNYKSNNDATCTADGTKTAKCDNCDETDTITDEGTAKGHSFTKKDTDSKYLASEATCTAAAKYYYSCANCGATGTETFDYGEANGHSFTNYVANTNATCTKNATEKANCDNCTATDTRDVENSALGHRFDQLSGVKANNDGTHSFKCVRCETYGIDTTAGGSVACSGGTANCVDKAVCTVCSAEYGEVDSKNHKTVVTDKGYAATCDEVGYNDGSHCSACNTTIVAKTQIPATGHDYDYENGVLTRPVQQDDGTWSKGYYTYTCKNNAAHTTTKDVERADYTKYDEAIKNLETLLENDLTEEAKENINKAIEEAKKLQDNLITTEQDKVDKVVEDLEKALEDNKGTLKTYEVEFVDDNGNAIGETQFIISGGSATAPADPTKDADATYHYTFDKWDTDYTNVTTNLTVKAVFTSEEHAFSHTYKDEANHTDKCACGYEADVAHSWNDGEITTAPKCEEKGVKTFTCSLCNGTKDEDVDALGHQNPVHHKAVPATCISTGTVEYWSCSSCGKNFSGEDCKDEITDITAAIDSSNHTNTEDKAQQDATCTDGGYTAGTYCKDCKTWISGHEEITASGHDWADATCTTPKTCKTCGATEGDALGHDWADATCTAPKTCKTCGATEGEALGHDWADATCTEPKTCKTCGATEGEALGHDYDYDNGVLTRPVQQDDGTWSKGYYTYTCKNNAAHTTTKYVERADYTEYDKAIEDLKDLLDKDLTDDAKEAIEKAIEDAEKLDKDLIEDEQDKLDKVVADLEKVLEDNNGTLKRYEVTFVDGDGNILWQDQVVSGGTPNPNSIPTTATKSADATYHYTFSGWDNDFTNVTSTLTITAQFTSEKHTFSHTYKDEANHTDACSCGYEKDVAHSWNDGEITTAPKCEEKGVKTFTCSLCNGTKTEDVDALGHQNPVHHKAVPATCISTGTVEYWSCSSCGKNFSGEDCKDEITDITAAIDSSNHTNTEDKAQQDATCTDGGYTAGTYCKDCKTWISGHEEITASGHDWADATCTTPKTCKTCGTTEGDALGHDWADATCTEPKTCKTCGATEGEALGHDWADATCTEPKTCKTCGATEGEALGHDWADATCTAPKTCKTCGTTDGEALGHDWADATCTTPKTCKTCGTTEGEALGHDWADATCTAPKTCKTCGATDGEALGHKNTELVNVKTADCQNAGYTGDTYCKDCKTTIAYGEETSKDLTNHVSTETYTKGYKDSDCKNEGYTGDTYHKCCDKLVSKGEVITKKSHTPKAAVKENFVDSTCKKEGSYDEVVYCSVCGDKLSSTPKTVAKKAHDWKAATCTAPKTCKVCGATEGNALGHKEATLVAKAPTCTTTGLTEGKYCSVCHLVLKAQTTVPATGHAWGEWTQQSAASCDQAEVLVRYCGTCGISETKTGAAALGHTDSDGDGNCDHCGGNMGTHCDENCNCICHKKSFFGKIVRFVYTIISIIFHRRITCCPGMEYLVDISKYT